MYNVEDFVASVIQKEIVYRNDCFHKWNPGGNHILHRQMKREEKRQRRVGGYCPYFSRMNINTDTPLILYLLD